MKADWDEVLPFTWSAKKHVALFDLSAPCFPSTLIALYAQWCQILNGCFCACRSHRSPRAANTFRLQVQTRPVRPRPAFTTSHSAERQLHWVFHLCFFSNVPKEKFISQKWQIQLKPRSLSRRRGRILPHTHKPQHAAALWDSRQQNEHAQETTGNNKRHSALTIGWICETLSSRTSRVPGSTRGTACVSRSHSSRWKQEQERRHFWTWCFYPPIFESLGNVAGSLCPLSYTPRRSQRMSAAANTPLHTFKKTALLFAADASDSPP